MSVALRATTVREHRNAIPKESSGQGQTYEVRVAPATLRRSAAISAGTSRALRIFNSARGPFAAVAHFHRCSRSSGSKIGSAEDSCSRAVGCRKAVRKDQLGQCQERAQERSSVPCQ